MSLKGGSLACLLLDLSGLSTLKQPLVKCVTGHHWPKIDKLINLKESQLDHI
jgi:hypothetical protein